MDHSAIALGGAGERVLAGDESAGARADVCRLGLVVGEAEEVADDGVLLAGAERHFEAGVVFGASERQVFPYFLGSNAAEIKEPLNAIQALTTTKDGTRRLVEALAEMERVEEKLPAERFDQLWPELQQLLRDIDTPRFADLHPNFERLFQRKTFYEPIDECADQVWLDRYDAARDTQAALKGYEAIVRSAARPWQVWLFEKLLGHVDAYARLLRVYLLVERGFKPGARRLYFASPRPFLACRSALMPRMRRLACRGRYDVRCAPAPR